MAAVEESGTPGPIEEEDISHAKTIRIALRCAPLKTRQNNSTLDVVGDGQLLAVELGNATGVTNINTLINTLQIVDAW